MGRARGGGGAAAGAIEKRLAWAAKKGTSWMGRGLGPHLPPPDRPPVAGFSFSPPPSAKGSPLSQ